MKANEFFKAMGIKAVKQFLENDNIRTKEMHDELKRLVESHELVEMHGSTKWFFIANYCQEHRLAPHQSDVYSFVASKFDKAIADVESCNVD